MSVRKQFRNLAEALYALDRVSEVLKLFTIRRISPNRRISVGRFYVAISNVLVPLMIERRDNISVKGSLEPSTTLHIHENYVFLSRSLGVNGDPMQTVLMMREGVPGISLVDGEEAAVSLIAASIAEKLRTDPEAYRIARLLPNNLRVLVERAREQSDSVIDIIELCLRLSRCVQSKAQRKHCIVELRIWTSKNRAIELPYEISYIKSFGSGYLRLRYLGGELDLRSLSLNLVDTIMPRLVPMSVIEELVNNIVKTVRILSIATKLLEQR